MRIGVDVGGSHIGLGLVNKDGKLVLKAEKDYDKIQEDMSNIVLETIIELPAPNIQEINDPAIHMPTICQPFRHQKIPFLPAGQRILYQQDQTGHKNKENTMHISPGKVHMHKTVAFFIQKEHFQKTHDQLKPGEPIQCIGL